MPIISSPWSLYFSYHALRYGNVRWQLMQLYVKKSTRMTFSPTSSPIVIDVACPELVVGVFTKPDGLTISLYGSPDDRTICAGAEGEETKRNASPAATSTSKSEPIMYSALI